MRGVFTLPLLTVLLVAFAAGGQEVSSTPMEEEAVPEAAPEEPEADRSEEVVEPDGDIVVLKTGKEIRGFQVLRARLDGYELEVSEGLPPLFIPKRQVADIAYDNIDPIKLRRMRALEPDKSAEKVVEGRKIAPELSKKLSTNISGVEIDEGPGDYVEVLRSVCAKLGVELIVGPELEKLRPAERVWDYEIGDNTTLLTLLRDDLLGGKPDLEVVYQFDKVLLTTKEHARTLE